MADVDMKPAAEEQSKVEEEAKETPPPPPPTPVQEIKANVALIERAVSTLEPRFTIRVLRSLNILRRKLNDGVLRDAIGEVYRKGMHRAILLPKPRLIDTTVDHAVGKALLSLLPEAPPSSAEASMDIDAALPSSKVVTSADPPPECEVYLRLLIIHNLLASPSTRSKTFPVAHETVEKIQAWNRRSMDALAARVWFALGRTYELAGELADVRP